MAGAAVAAADAGAGARLLPAGIRQTRASPRASRRFARLRREVPVPVSVSVLVLVLLVRFIKMVFSFYVGL
ncbi:hypothetical protein J53TS2_39700 [Paenibacillus sp. J53TS2]|nr:hypothetical protein J53TS2_39700 [Paenibacillus sp. J53TS2]